MNKSKIYYRPSVLHVVVIDVVKESRNSIRPELADIWVEEAVKVVDDLFMFWRQVNGAGLDFNRLDDLHAIYKGVRAWQK